MPGRQPVTNTFFRASGGTRRRKFYSELSGKNARLRPLLRGDSRWANFIRPIASLWAILQQTALVDNQSVGFDLGPQFSQQFLVAIFGNAFDV